MRPSAYQSDSAETPARYSSVLAVNSTVPSRTMRWSLFSGWPPSHNSRSWEFAAKESVRKDSGISSACPLPFGSCVAKATRASWYSSIVVGMGSPTASSQVVLMNRKFGNCRIPSSSTEGRV